MKKFGLIAISAFVTILCFGQTNETSSGRQFIDRTTGGNILYSFQYEDVKGSPFLSDDWKTSKIIVGTTMFVNVELKFDLVNNEFVFIRNDSNYTLAPSASEIRMFSKNGDSSVFKKGFEIGNAVPKSKYVQILTNGKIALIKNLSKGIEEYTEYGDATKYKRFSESVEYYTLKNNSFEPIKINKKDLQSLLADKWDKVSQYMTQNNLSGKDEKSFTAAINYYNTL